MAPPLEARGTIVAQAQLAGGRSLLTVEAPAVAALAGAGQFAMLRCAEGWEPYLRRALPFLRLGAATCSFLFRPGDDAGLAWLARRRLGDAVSLLGPLGHGFVLQPPTRRLLVAAGGSVAPLLALAGAALARGISVSLALDATVARDLASIIPAAVEVLTPAPDAADGRPGTLWELAAATAPWADQVAATGPAEALARLARQGGVRRSGFVQCYVEVPLACGLGWCGSCLTETRRGPRRACVSGPVFDVAELAGG